MAVLSNAEREQAARLLGHRIFTELGASATVDFTQLVETIGSTDDWVEANAASFNQSIPIAIRTILTPAQKAELLAFVARKKTGAI